MSAKDNITLIQDQSKFIDSISEGRRGKKRKDAYKKWLSTDIPTSRDEYWKYTRMAPVLKRTYGISQKASPFNKVFLRDIDAYRLVFINGVFSEENSDRIVEDDFVVSNMNYILEHRPELIENSMKETEDGDYFSLLNEAFHLDGPFVFAGKNKKANKAIHLVHLCTENDRLINNKGMVLVEMGSEVDLIETWDDDKGKECFMNSRMDYFLQANSNIEVTKIEAIGSDNNLVSQDFIDQATDSRFTTHTLSMQGKLIRNNINANLNGEGAECNMNGLYMARGEEHIDNHTRIVHAVPNCNSNELYKGILNEHSKGVFNGKVIVSRDAQKTNAFQYNGNILLTDDCQVYSKPELEIYADDVKCSHGSTTGQLDQEALFYLQSRGIGKEKARNLLLQAFAGEVLEKISNDKIKERIGSYISERYQTHD